MASSITIYADVNVPVICKSLHVRKPGHIHNPGKHVSRSFISDFGTLPVASWNEQTQKFEPVVNTRGVAYAARNRRKYRRKDRD